jgi:dTDP-D-glucose 4,6-dehydratase
MEGKGRFLILGGVGFIGRHLVKYLYDNKLADFVCVADKVPYAIATLSEDELAIFKNESFLAFKQADLRQQRMTCNSSFFTNMTRTH